MKKFLSIFMAEADQVDAKFKIYMPGMIIGLAIVLAIISAAIVVSLRRQGRDIFSPTQMQIYFYSPAEGRLYAENRPWPHGDQNDWVLAAVGHLRFPPNTSTLNSTWPNFNPLLGVEETPFLQRIGMQGSTVIAEFYPSYFDMSPIEEALFRSALTLTMTGFDFVEDVKIRVDGREWLESSDTIANGPAISAARLGNTVLTLYFIDQSGEGLVREYYNAVEVDIQQRVRVALEKLIDDVSVIGFSAMPAETRILAVVPVVETGTVYVNFSGDFITRFTGGHAQAQLMLAAITNTVIENSPGVRPRSVFFLIDSDREQNIPGFADFSKAFEYEEIE